MQRRGRSRPGSVGRGSCGLVHGRAPGHQPRGAGCASPASTASPCSGCHPAGGSPCRDCHPAGAVPLPRLSPCRDCHPAGVPLPRGSSSQRCPDPSRLSSLAISPHHPTHPSRPGARLAAARTLLPLLSSALCPCPSQGRRCPCPQVPPDRQVCDHSKELRGCSPNT